MGQHYWPTVVAHADWSLHPDKRWLVRASRQPNGGYLAHAPEPVGPAETLVQRLQAAAPDGGVFLGLDLPIGLPVAYARLAGIDDFLAAFPNFGQGQWSHFYQVAERPDQISLQRPFYPQRPGGTKQTHLLQSLSVSSIDALRRRCDRPQPHRRAAAPIFWTMGPQQVGKAAINAWQSLLLPALQANTIDIAIWPFSGPLFELFQPKRVIISETYPAECYSHLGVTFPRQASQSSGKRSQAARQANAAALLSWAQTAQIDLDPILADQIRGGFGAKPGGEDPFDATVGLFGMLNIIQGNRPPGLPDDEDVRKIEGWILGLLDE